MNQTKKERLERLKKLNQKLAEGTAENHREVVEEHKRAQLPTNFEKKQQWIETKIQKEEAKELAKAKGEDYQRKQYLNYQADEAERWERRQKSKHNPDDGFSSYDDATARQYERLIKQVKPNLGEYEEKKQTLGEEIFYPTKDTPVQNVHKDTKEAIDRVVEDLSKQVEKRHKFSRRRRFDDDADIDYINEKNMRFNKNLERFYGKYTQEIKQNLERGTAV